MANRYVGLSDSRDRIAAAYRRRYRGRSAVDLVSEVAPAEADREAFRGAGRALVEAIVRFVDADVDDERATAEAGAQAATVDLAHRLADQRVDVPPALEAFIAARQPVLAEIASIGRRRNLTGSEVLDLYARATVLLDRLVVTFATAVSDRSDAR